MLESKLLSFHKNAQGRSSQHGRVHDSFIKRIYQCYISLKRKRKEIKREMFLAKDHLKHAQVMYLRQKSRYWKGCEGYSRFTSTGFLSLILLVILSFSFCHRSDKRSVRTLFLYWVIKACMLWPVKRRHLRFEPPHIRYVSNVKAEHLDPIIKRSLYAQR